MSYKSTVKACYMGIVCQAILVNIAALLFTVLGAQFGLSYTQLGSLVLINFIMQVVISLLFGNVVDRVGFRPFIVGAHILGAAGMAWFAATPWLPFPYYATLMMGALIFGAASGFLELLLSPILNAIPTDEKSSSMSILHSFYAFGHLMVAIGTTLFLAVFGREAWPIVVFFWLLVPLANAALFVKCPIAPAVPVAQQSSAGTAFTKPLFIMFIVMIAFAGASELAFSQWASAFMEEAMGLPKAVGDIAGVGTFALAMGLGRIGYGILKQKGVAWLPEQSYLMLMGSILAAASYIIVATTHNPVLGLLACAMCGLGISLLWPGTLSLAVAAFPKAGTWIFAVMAIGGNFGAAAGPAVLGVVADHAGLRAGYMVTAAIPLGLVMVLMMFHRLRRS